MSSQGRYPFISAGSAVIKISCWSSLRENSPRGASGDIGTLVPFSYSHVFSEVGGELYLGAWVDFLKVLRFSFPVPVVGPSAKDFYPLQRAKFTGGIFLPFDAFGKTQITARY